MALKYIHANFIHIIVRTTSGIVELQKVIYPRDMKICHQITKKEINVVQKEEEKNLKHLNTIIFA